jgi:hypothetical protein
MKLDQTSAPLKPALFAAVTAIALLATAPADAIPMVQNYNIDFSSPTQAFGAPGQSAASFGTDRFILGNSC